MTRPVTRVVCTHPGRAERSEPTEMGTWEDRWVDPWVSTCRGEPELQAEIVRVRGPMPSETGLPDRSGVTCDGSGRPLLWTLRCSPCGINVEVRAATLGVVFDALYPVVDADADGGRTVELAVIAAVASRRRDLLR